MNINTNIFYQFYALILLSFFPNILLSPLNAMQTEEKEWHLISVMQLSDNQLNKELHTKLNNIAKAYNYKPLSPKHISFLNIKIRSDYADPIFQSLEKFLQTEIYEFYNSLNDSLLELKFKGLEAFARFVVAKFEVDTISGKPSYSLQILSENLKEHIDQFFNNLHFPYTTEKRDNMDMKVFYDKEGKAVAEIINEFSPHISFIKKEASKYDKFKQQSTFQEITNNLNKYQKQLQNMSYILPKIGSFTMEQPIKKNNEENITFITKDRMVKRTISKKNQKNITIEEPATIFKISKRSIKSPELLKILNAYHHNTLSEQKESQEEQDAFQPGLTTQQEEQYSNFWRRILNFVTMPYKIFTS